MPLGVVLVVIGMAGSATACLQNESFGAEHAQTQPTGQTDTQASPDSASGLGVLLAPLPGLLLAAGVLCIGLGAGHWKRPVPSDVLPAKPRSRRPNRPRSLASRRPRKPTALVVNAWRGAMTPNAPRVVSANVVGCTRSRACLTNILEINHLR